MRLIINLWLRLKGLKILTVIVAFAMGMIVGWYHDELEYLLFELLLLPLEVKEWLISYFPSGNEPRWP